MTRRSGIFYYFRSESYRQYLITVDKIASIPVQHVVVRPRPAENRDINYLQVNSKQALKKVTPYKKIILLNFESKLLKICVLECTEKQNEAVLKVSSTSSYSRIASTKTKTPLKPSLYSKLHNIILLSKRRLINLQQTSAFCD